MGNRNFKQDPHCRTIGKIYVRAAVTVPLWQKERPARGSPSSPLPYVLEQGSPNHDLQAKASPQLVSVWPVSERLGGQKIKSILHDICKWYEIQISGSINKAVLNTTSLICLRTGNGCCRRHERSRHGCVWGSPHRAQHDADAVTAWKGLTCPRECQSVTFSFLFFFLNQWISIKTQSKRGLSMSRCWGTTERG